MRATVSLLLLLFSLYFFPSSLSASSWNSRAASLPLPCAEKLPHFSFELSPVYRPDNAFLALWASYLAESDHAELIQKTLTDWGFQKIQLIGHASQGANAYLAEAEDFHLLVFRGTKSFLEQTMDALFMTSPYFGLGMEGWGHSGFALQFAYLWSQLSGPLKNLDKNKPFVVTGHSLGGALALLHAVRLQRESYFVNAVYTSGQPRVGDPDFYEGAEVTLGGRYYRLENAMDFTSRIPPSAAAADGFARLVFTDGSWGHKSLSGLVRAMNYASPASLKVALDKDLDISFGTDQEDDEVFWSQVRHDLGQAKNLADLSAMIKAQADRHVPATYICKFLAAYAKTSTLGSSERQL